MIKQFLLLILFGSMPSIAYADISTGLIGWWKFDESSGTSAIDSSTGGNTGTLQNNPTRVAGKLGNALTFVGTSLQYVDLGTAISPGSQATFAFWIKTTSTTANERVFGKETSDYDTPFVFWKPPGGNAYNFFTSKSAGGNAYADVSISATGINNGAWHHIVATVSSTTITTYLDNVQKNTGAWTHGIKASSENTFVGWSAYPSTTYFNGTLDEVRIYDRALSAEDVAQLYEYTCGAYLKNCQINNARVAM